MSKTKGALIFLLLIVMILGTMNSAMAARGKDIATHNPIDDVIEKGAKGKAFNGTLAIYYYHPDPNNPDQYNMNMLIMMRLRYSSNWYPFAGIMTNVNYPLFGDVDKMVDFLNNHVTPRLIAWGVVKAGAVAKYRNYSNTVEDDMPNFPYCCSFGICTPPPPTTPCPNPINFVIMDIEVAISD